MWTAWINATLYGFYYNCWIRLFCFQYPFTPKNYKTITTLTLIVLPFWDYYEQPCHWQVNAESSQKINTFASRSCVSHWTYTLQMNRFQIPQNYKTNRFLCSIFFQMRFKFSLSYCSAISVNTCAKVRLQTYVLCWRDPHCDGIHHLSLHTTLQLTLFFLCLCIR